MAGLFLAGVLLPVLFLAAGAAAFEESVTAGSLQCIPQQSKAQIIWLSGSFIVRRIYFRVDEARGALLISTFVLV